MIGIKFCSMDLCKTNLVLESLFNSSKLTNLGGLKGFLLSILDTIEITGGKIIKRLSEKLDRITKSNEKNGKFIKEEYNRLGHRIAVLANRFFNKYE